MHRQLCTTGKESGPVAGPFQALKAYAELTKPRIALMILLVGAASFQMASRGAPPWPRLAVAVAGIGLLAAGILALNQSMEVDSDRLMRRTAGRPLPSGRLAPSSALAFGGALTAASFALIVPVLGWVAGGVALATFVSYVLIYTPLKKRTSLHTVVGAISGAMPPLLGWAAARGSLDADAWILAGILFFWQLPHLSAVDTLHADDYARAGTRVLPAVGSAGGGATAAVILGSLLLLLAVSVLPWHTGLAGPLYLAVAMTAGAGFLLAAVLLLVRGTTSAARLLLRASVIYLPVLFAAMVLNPAV